MTRTRNGRNTPTMPEESESTESTETTTESTESTETTEDTGTGRTFTQEDLTKVGTKEHRRGKAEAAKALAEELGMPVAEAKKILAERAKDEEAKKDETDKAREAAQAARAEAEDAKAQLRQVTLRAALLEGLTAGDGQDVHPVQPGYRDAALDLALVNASRSDTEDMDELVAEAIEAVRKSAPVFFGPGEGGTGSAGGTTGAPKRTGAQTGPTSTSAQETAKAMLEKHKPKPLTLPAFGKPSGTTD